MKLIHLRLLLLALLTLWLGSAHALGADPWANWRSADSTHFRVHYRGEQRAQAENVARAAERAYARISPALQWVPSGRIELVVYSEFDVANGFSTPLPYNLVGAFLAPPDGELLDNSPWLDLLLTHELVHAIHLDKVRSAPGVLRMIFGRVAWFFPNVFQPPWAMEGLATWFEGAQDGGVAAAATLGRGRLYGPNYEGWLRAEQARGFLKLNELNSDGRALPLAKSYLYGGYFFDFLARRYGRAAVGQFVENYSGNIVPRFHSNPREATGKAMDELWDEFLADLDTQVTQRASALRAQPEVLGRALDKVHFDIPSVASLPDGRTLAVLDDGVGATELVQFDTFGRRQVLATLGGMAARLDANARGELLITQADLCNTHYLGSDLYRWDAQGGSVQRLTHCAHLRRATQAGERILALQLDAGRTRLVSLDRNGADLRPVYTPPEGSDLVDLAASADGQRVQLIERQAGDWRIVELDLAPPGAAARRLFEGNTPIHSLRATAQGLEFIAAHEGVTNVWRLAGGRLQRLTHSHTGVVAHGGSLADGSLATVVIAADGYRLHRQEQAAALQTLALAGGQALRLANAGWSPAVPASSAAAASAPVAAAAAPAPAAPATSPAAAQPAGTASAPALGEDRRYLPLTSMYPRSWWPLITSDRGLTAYGASTNGSDALGWHQYALAFQWETSQREAVGALEYLWLNSQMLSLQRTITPLAWRDRGSSKYDTLAYERHTQAQWLSTLPVLQRLQRRVNLGIGAAFDRIEVIQTEPESRRTARNDKLAAALIDYDSRESNWWSEGANRGLRASLLYETYQPFLSREEKAAGTGYDGHVIRADLRGYVPLGRSVLALRHTEARASGRTRPYQLGGATDPQLQLGYTLNSRDLSLRGYSGDDAALVGQSARVSSVEWRTPLADIDRHGMVPPLGINRLSGAVFFDIGGAWNVGASKPASYYRGVGVELLGELKLLYALGLNLRLGVARGLDEPKDTVGYLSFGRAF
ncbi:hypothetical protein [Sphaerotilus microaerophilus]|uniref:hypothetical protein n=1 Tax=Sphaerotilus microaerophilus TaxID=2914710 RepID=UPI002073BCE2|nr:hypothetical protein [Sphaerotilus sp. FB-5]